MNSNIKDENTELSAYIDNELSADERTQFEQRLAASAELRNKLEEFKNNDNMIRAAAQEFDNAPMPENIQRLLNGDDALLERLDTHYTEKEINSESRAATPIRHTWWNWQRSVAASIMLVIGIFSVQQYFDSPQAETVLLLSDTHEPLPALKNILSETLSGNTFEYDHNIVTPELTFTRQDDALCRQYRIQNLHDSIRGVACIENHEWVNMVITSTHTADDNTNSTYQPANSKTEKDISRYIQSKIKGIPLNTQEEIEIFNQKK